MAPRSSTSTEVKGQTVSPSSSTAGFFQILPTLEPQFTLVASTSTSSRSPGSLSDDPVLDRILNLYLSPSHISTKLGPALHDVSRLVLSPEVLQHAVDAETNPPTLQPLGTFGEVNKIDPLRTSNGWKKLKEIGVGLGVVSRAYHDFYNKNNNNDNDGDGNTKQGQRDEASYNRRIDQFAICHAWSHTATLTMCPMTMTDGAATLMKKFLLEQEAKQSTTPTISNHGSTATQQKQQQEEEQEEKMRRHCHQIFTHAYDRLTSSDPSAGKSFTSGQWMTERSGGSDVRGTETVAHRVSPQELHLELQNPRGGGGGGDGQAQLDASGQALGPWRIDGFKWFSSATDSDLTMLLAQTDKGLSAFFVPMRRRARMRHASTVSSGVPVRGGGSMNMAPVLPSELNGIRIQRLKNKMGTKALPTAELELVGTRGWLIGEEGRGVKYISVILNITRLHTAMGSVSYWSRGLSVCRAYSKVRAVRGKLLTENVSHVKWMSGECVKYRAATMFVFFGAALMGVAEGGRGSMAGTRAARGLIPVEDGHVGDLLRLLTPVMKAQCSLAAVEGLRSCMECLGGVGYCENSEDGGVLNLAKLFRDSVVNTIWEGTVSVMADDVGRVLKDKRIARGRIVEDVFAPWVRNCLSGLAKSPDVEVEKRVVEERLQALLDLVTVVKGDPAELEYRGRDLLQHLEVLTSASVLLYDASTDDDDVASHIASRYIWSRVLVLRSKYTKPRSNWQTETVIDRKIFLGTKYGGGDGEVRGKL